MRSIFPFTTITAEPRRRVRPWFGRADDRLARAAIVRRSLEANSHIVHHHH
jgi:hypothetical protein